MKRTPSEVKPNVRRLLKETPALRDDYTELILNYWVLIDGAEVIIKCSKPLTKPATIIRRSQEIQAEERQLPTNSNVRRRRGKSK